MGSVASSLNREHLAESTVTLAVAARFPWPGLVDSWPEDLRKVVDTFPRFRPRPGMVMVADSRWTFPKRGAYEDGAVKLARVSPNALAVYSGDTEIGPRGIGRMTEEVEALVGASSPKIARIARQSLQSAWRQYALEDSALQVLLGIHHKDSGFHLWRYSHDDGFLPRESDGIETIGSDAGRIAFWEELHAQVRRKVGTPLSQAPFRADLEEWGTIIAIAVHQTCRSQLDRTVGGPMLVGQITETGVQGRSLHVVEKGEPSASEQVTLTWEQVDAFQTKHVVARRARPESRRHTSTVR